VSDDRWYPGKIIKDILSRSGRRFQVTYDHKKGVWTYRCPVDGVLLTSLTKDGLYGLIHIHIRGHK
jgi:hypothetical protein